MKKTFLTLSLLLLVGCVSLKTHREAVAMAEMRGRLIESDQLVPIARECIDALDKQIHNMEKSYRESSDFLYEVKISSAMPRPPWLYNYTPNNAIPIGNGGWGIAN